MVNEEKLWYYTKGDGEKYGPYTDQELIRLIQQGILGADDYIWMVDLEEWLLIGNTIYSFYLEKVEKQQEEEVKPVE